ncbi:MAG TPA: aldo/keto reductase [Streptosporangiaceae bacterium]|nr:aldo/keto reductase [Streptosporangiaceae bacterium]
MKYRRLGPSGPVVSELAFGASPLGGIYGTFAERDAIAAVHAALDSGINFLDVSPYYGLTAAETVLGKALRGVNRDSYILATKVGRYGDDVFDFTAEGVTSSARASLKRLGVEHIDLIQCHDVEFGSLEQVVHETVPALRALQETGLVRWIGVTGYPLPALLAIAERVPVDTVMSYCQYTLQDRRLAARAPEFSAAGAALINASPLGMGALTDRGAPAWHPARTDVLACCAQAAAVCAQRGADLAKLALQFSVATGPCATTVVGSASAGHIRRNLAWIAEPIDADLLAEVDELIAPVRDQGWANGRPENQNPGPLR